MKIQMAQLQQTDERTNPGLPEVLALAVAFLVMYYPSYVSLSHSVWNVVGQGHGPVMLAVTLWLAYQRWPALLALPAKPDAVSGTALFCLGLAFYILGHSQDILLFDIGSQIPMCMAALLIFKGWRAVKHMWFPLFFMIFLIPLPSPLVDAMTGPLKAAVSVVAENIMYAAGFPIGRSGVTLTIGQYQLMVADACAGLNSIFALEATGVFYISVAGHVHSMRNILLAILILPITFCANVLRVISLVLITYYFGDEVGQGFVHEFASIFLFVIATMLMMAVDAFLGEVLKPPPKPEAALSPAP
jgi:exosortase B